MSKRTIALGLSLLLNALLVGFILGDLARPVRGTQALAEMGRHYPDEIRAELRANLRSERADLVRGLRAFDTTRAEMFAEMRKPDADRARIEALMADIRQITGEVQAALQRHTLDAVMSQPADVRARIETPRITPRLLSRD